MDQLSKETATKLGRALFRAWDDLSDADRARIFEEAQREEENAKRQPAERSGNQDS